MLSVAPAIAQTPEYRAPRAPDGRPDLNGIWQALNTAHWDIEPHAAGPSVVHCPRSNLKLASGACPVAALLAAGVNTALGTDGAASNNRLDLWAEMETAALLGKHVAQNPEAIPASAALKMATINGARALGLADEIGSLVAGKSADVICVELTEAAVRPVLDPLSQLVYCAGREHVTDVWVAGEHLLAARSLTRMEPATILERADQWGQRILDS